MTGFVCSNTCGSEHAFSDLSKLRITPNKQNPKHFAVDPRNPSCYNWMQFKLKKYKKGF